MKVEDNSLQAKPLTAWSNKKWTTTVIGALIVMDIIVGDTVGETYGGGLWGASAICPQ